MGDTKSKSYNSKQIDNFHTWLKRSGYILTSLVLVIGAGAILIARITSNIAPQPETFAASDDNALLVTVPGGDGTLKGSATGETISTISGTITINPSSNSSSATAVRLVEVSSNKVFASGISSIAFDTTKQPNGFYKFALYVTTGQGTAKPILFDIVIAN